MSWTLEQAEAYLRSLELFGMRFGLDRIRRLLTALGSPQQRFRAVHVVGSNGKSSTTRFIAALLEAHGLKAGTYLSPHLYSYTERVLVGGLPIAPERLAAAIERAAHASEQVNRTLRGDDHVTQFELLTAASFYALAEAGVEVAAIEAGLGGRYDATNVLAAPVCVLTNVSLEHTRWLGPTVAAIAREKLAVVPAGGQLVLGPEPHPDVLALAQALAREQGVVVEVTAPPEAAGPWRDLPPFQRHNLATAELATRLFLEGLGVPFSPDAVVALLERAEVAGRFHVVGDDPLVLFDGAHNPAAAKALAQALQERFGSRPYGLVLGVLEDKDAAGILAELLPGAARAWFTAPPGRRALPAATLQALAEQQGFSAGETVPNPHDALAAARAWAAAEGDTDPYLLVTGSIYLLGELLEATVSPASEERRGGQR